jgi:hypothetical protein
MNYSKIFILCTLIELLAISSGCTDCTKLEEEAWDLVADHQYCTAGDSCVLVDLDALAGKDNCFEAFRENTALNAKTDLNKFEKDVKDLVDQYARCSDCPPVQGHVGEPEEVYCDLSIKRCEVRWDYRPGDGGVDTDTILDTDTNIRTTADSESETSSNSDLDSGVVPNPSSTLDGGD